MPATKPKIVTHVMLVEGKDDLYVVAELIDRHEIEIKFWIDDNEGITNLLDAIGVYLKKTETECIGIVIDADEDPGIVARWASIRGRLSDAGYTTVPESPAPDGTVIKEPDRSVIGVWLMPNNRADGMLEDFVGMLVPESDAMWEWADECVNTVPPCPQRFLDIHRAKARIHTWLAWQREPGTPMGSAIKKRYLDGTTEYGGKFADWIRRLLQTAPQ